MGVCTDYYYDDYDDDYYYYGNYYTDDDNDADDAEDDSSNGAYYIYMGICDYSDMGSVGTYILIYTGGRRYISMGVLLHIYI